MATCRIELFSEPKLFSTPGKKIPAWIEYWYFRLTLVVDSNGMIQGTRTIAHHLGMSQSTAMELVKWLTRLKLLVVIEPSQGRRGTMYQLRRFFVNKPAQKNFVNGNPYKVYKKNLKTNTYGDGPRFKRYATMHLRQAVTRVKTLSEDQRLTITKLVGKLIWKANIQHHQVKALFEWLTNILPHYEKLKLTGRRLANWFIGKVQRFASPSTDRWRQEWEEEDRAYRQLEQRREQERQAYEAAEKASWDRLPQGEKYRQRLLAWAMARECLYGELMAVGWGDCLNEFVAERH